MTGLFYVSIDRKTSLPIVVYMERSKIVAVVSGAISIILAIAYLLIVQLIDFRGEMLPAPMVETILWGFWA
jgi:hypothetical protein